MMAIEAPEPVGGNTPPSGGVPDADQTALPIPATTNSDADTHSDMAIDRGNIDHTSDPALDLAERLLALQYGNPAQRDLARFALQVITVAENTERNPDDDGLADGGGDERDAEPIPADVLSYRAGVAGIDACESLASALQAARARITTHAHAHSRAALRHGDLTPGQVIQHADDGVDRVLTGTQILATDLAVVLHAPTGLVSNQVTEATQLVHHMPRTLARLQSGELTDYHWRLISTHVHHRTPDDLEILDEALSARSFHGTGSYTGLGEDRATTTAVKRRLDHALARIGDEPSSTAKRKSGFTARYVGVGPVGDDGMSSLHGLVPAVHARAIDTLLTDLARTAPEDDERTVEQRRADAFLTLFTGPAALAPPLQAELDLTAASFDEEGQYTVVDPAQNLYAGETWETIRLLAASLGLTFPDVPRAVVNLDVTAETITHAHHLAAHPAASSPLPGRAAHARGPGCAGDVCPPPEPGSTGDVCPDSVHDRRPPRSGAETPQDANARCTSGPGADAVPHTPEGAAADAVLHAPGGIDTASSSGTETSQDDDATSTNGSGGYAVPHVIDSINPDTAGDAAIDQTPNCAGVDEGVSPRLRAATVRGVGDIPGQLAVRLLRHADLRRIITDPITGQPLEVGRRRPNTALRNAVFNRDRTCRFPGCNRVPLSMELDHITPYDDARPAERQTVPQNLQCLCKLHHRAKHQLQWTPVMNDNATITWRNNLLHITATT